MRTLKTKCMNCNSFGLVKDCDDNLHELRCWCCKSDFLVFKEYDVDESKKVTNHVKYDGSCLYADDEIKRLRLENERLAKELEGAEFSIAVFKKKWDQQEQELLVMTEDFERLNDELNTLMFVIRDVKKLVNNVECPFD